MNSTRVKSETIKTKIIIVIAIVGILGWRTVAQTNEVNLTSAITNQYRLVLVTNWIVPTPDYRVVDGNVYNIRNSTNWVNLRDNLIGSKPGQFGYEYIANEFRMEVIQVGKKSVFCKIYPVSAIDSHDISGEIDTEYATEANALKAASWLQYIVSLK